MTLTDEAAGRVAFKLGIPKKSVTKAYWYYWKFIKDKINELPLKKEMTENEFSKLKTSFNINGLGKLYCPYDKYKKIHISYKKYIENAKHKKDKTDVQLHACDM